MAAALIPASTPPKYPTIAHAAPAEARNRKHRDPSLATRVPLPTPQASQPPPSAQAFNSHMPVTSQRPRHPAQSSTYHSEGHTPEPRPTCHRPSTMPGRLKPTQNAARRLAQVPKPAPARSSPVPGLRRLFQPKPSSHAHGYQPIPHTLSPGSTLHVRAPQAQEHQPRAVRPSPNKLHAHAPQRNPSQHAYAPGPRIHTTTPHPQAFESAPLSSTQPARFDLRIQLSRQSPPPARAPLLPPACAS